MIELAWAVWFVVWLTGVVMLLVFALAYLVAWVLVLLFCPIRTQSVPITHGDDE